VDGPSSSAARRERRLRGITVLVCLHRPDVILCDLVMPRIEDHLLKPVDGETVVRTVARVVTAARQVHPSS
jgi:CheY-like chemotaxis protein